jgi:hypothetical protein
MKQGRSITHIAANKVEPNSRAIDPGAVSELGIHQVHVRSIPPLDAGRGYKAPMVSSSIHHCGSQGKH